jgi:thiol-disulfide isomerase/thioredoxin
VRTRSPLTVASLLTSLLLAQGTHPAPASAGEADRLAPSFAARTFDGKTFRLQEQRGKPIVLDFWATWCAPCLASMPHLNGLQERYARDGLVVVGLSVDDMPPSAVKKFADRLGVRFRLAMADEKLLDQYGPIRMLPTTFFINRRGEIVRRTVGYLDEETLDGYVRELF